jgi:MATE family multidrug resistance protein
MSLADANLALPATGAAARRRPCIQEAGALLRLGAPVMLISLVNMGMSLTDTAMVAAFFGTGALAAVAVGSDLYSIVFYLGAGVLGGFAPFYAAAVARGDGRERARLERIGRLAVALVAAATVPVVWFAPDWLVLLGLEPALLADGAGYTRAMAITLVPMLGVVLCRTLLTAAERPRVFLKVTLAMLPLNAAANYVLMPGLGPIPAFGPTGAGLGSLLVAMASLGLLALVARRAAGRTSRPAEPIDWRGLAPVLRVGLPIGIAVVAEVGVFLAATLYTATLGAAAVAAHTLTLRAAGVAYAVPSALLQASMVRMARADGVGDEAAARAVRVSSLLLSLGLGMALFLIIALGAGPLSGVLFDDSAAGLAAGGLALGLLVLLGAIELIGTPGLAAAGLLRGRKDTRAPMAFVLVGHWAVGAPVGVALCATADLGVTGIWIGLAVGTLVTTALTLARLATRTTGIPGRHINFTRP